MQDILRRGKCKGEFEASRSGDLSPGCAGFFINLNLKRGCSVIVLINFTDQGIRNVKQNNVATAEAEKLGIKNKDIYWTVGQYDALLVGVKIHYL